MQCDGERGKASNGESTGGAAGAAPLDPCLLRAAYAATGNLVARSNARIAQ